MKKALYISVVVFIIGCQSEKATTNLTKTNTFEKPIKGVDVLLQTQLVNTEKGDTLYLENNTRIIIPKNAFVDRKGNPIKGEVEINFQEYHTEAEVILSGIPMQYDSSGAQYTLETDGMFRISGEQKGSRIEIAPNKSLKVKTRSYKEDTPCFNYYTQNTDGKWNYQITKTRSLDTALIVQKEIEKLNRLDENSVGLDLKINYKKYPELKSLKSISWMYNGSKPDTLNLKLLEKVKWNDFELQKTDESLYSYLLVGTNKKNSFKMPITPAFSEDEIEIVQAQIKEKIRKEEEAYAKLKTEYEREAVINNFGTHNWDRSVYGDMIIVKASLEFEKPIKYFYVINRNDKYRFVNKYSSNLINKINFLKDGDVAIIAFLKEEKKVAYYIGSSPKNQLKLGIGIPLIEKEEEVLSASELQEIIDLI